MSLVEYPAAGAQAAKKELECTTSYHEGRADLAHEIAGIVERDTNKQMVIDAFLAQFGRRADLAGLAIAVKTDLTHEAALRQATDAGVDVLFELSPTKIDFYYGSGLKENPGCPIRPQVHLKYRVTRVSNDQELAAGKLSGRPPGAVEPGAQTVGRWLNEPGALAQDIAEAYAQAVRELMYGRNGPGFIFPEKHGASAGNEVKR
jgi:hypothetical protein